MTFSIDSVPLQHAVITAPYFGVWTAQVSVGGALTTNVSAVIELGDVARWAGTITSAILDGEITRATVIGGAAKLNSEIAARQWSGGHSYASIVNAIAAAAGETVADAPTGNAVDFGYTNITAGKALDAVSERAETPWRINAAGKITFAAKGIDPTGVIIRADLDGARIYSVDDADAEPFPLQAIEHEYINGELFTVIRVWRANRERRLTGVYEGNLASQSGTRVVVDCGVKGTFECDLWHGLQGVTVTLAVGSPMLVTQLSAERFIAMGHPDGSSAPTLISFDSGGDRNVARVDDTVDAGTLLVKTNEPQDVTYFPAGAIGTAAAIIALAAVIAGGGTGHLEAMTGGVITSGNPRLRA